jgi:hypothetical protein
MISGVYSTIYITGAFISLTRRNWKPQTVRGVRKAAPAPAKKIDPNVVQFPGGERA